MAASGALPYLVPRPDTVRFEPWTMFDEGWTALPAALAVWDTDTTLTISQTVHVDVDAAWMDTGLPAGTPLRLTASWTSSASGMRSLIAQSDVVASAPVVLQGTLHGQRVAGSLDIVTSLTPTPVQGVHRPTVPTAPGAVLAEHAHRLTVESNTTMFPTAVVDFASTKIDVSASWRLETTADLDAPFHGGFLLLINSRDSELVRAIEARSASTTQQTLLAVLEGEVASLLFELAVLDREALLARDDWVAESVGAVLRGFLKAAESHGLHSIAVDSTERAAYLARLAGLVRSRGHGRQFS
ncbi:hypothetical protein CLV46_2528 [Diaminobutyricimonas aerilata]|uniref:Uncharacterized protein n=1 Tax=Diaminobutyricimonas aerilata TaxID=1162967 RepID=A0A2M9CM34_9MICO|nr:hypothetical protein [Diaminobutyricimonas aerilata]PJJ72949.1 hypothetical protein CLV46_2528 [Diaminobutyricimonas aerilata]